MELIEIEACVEWIAMTQDRDQRLDFVNQIMNLRDL
jgi:hypothetical protein